MTVLPRRSKVHMILTVLDSFRFSIHHLICQRYYEKKHHIAFQKSNINRLPKTQTSGAFSVKASITVEASLTLPLLLGITALFLSFFTAQLWQLRLQKALDEIGEDIAVWSYALDFADDYSSINLLSLTEGSSWGEALSGNTADILSLLQSDEGLLQEVGSFLQEKGSALLWQQWVKACLIAKCGRDKLDASSIKKGAEGLSLSGSTLRNRELDLVLSYRFCPLFGQLFGLSVPVVQRSCRRLWIGTPVKKEETPQEEETEEEPLVYVTQNGTVYHKNLECRVFRIDPLQITLISVNDMRNEEGARYYACERCALGKEPQLLVWLTDFGNRYHHEKDCPSLKRQTMPLALSEAQEKYRPCGFCGGGP